jgi:GcrA cell cycle regulator
MSWTDERVETLKKMWTEGQSASQIAKELGGVTRNAVIGKVHRLGLSNRADEVEDIAPKVEAPKAEPKVETLRAETAKPDSNDATRVETAKAEVIAEETDKEEAVKPAARMESTLAPIPMRKAIIPAGQPLPPQPSANEISPEALASVREVEKRAMRLSLMDLTEKTCKWPIGDPATPEFWFCGLPSQPGKPYCEAHVGVAFQPMSARRDRRR